MTTDPGEKALETLDDFFSGVDEGTLLRSGTPEYFEALRDRLQSAVVQLLDNRRPYLEAEKGILWPYDGLRKRRYFFEDSLQHPSPSSRKEEALLFLARLPFPGQWKYLVQAEATLPERPEIRALRRFERDIVRRKIRQRGQKTYRIRRFCQVLKRPRLPKEKGILRIFSLLYLLADRRLLEDLSRYYVLYVEPTAGVMIRHTWLRAFSRTADPCIFGIAGPDDTVYVGSQPNVVTTELAHADFLQDDVSVDTGREKRFDLVFIGTFDEMRRKRHMRFLELLQHPKLHHTTALVIGQGNDANIREFTGAVRSRGLSARVTIRSNLPRNAIPESLDRCRIGVHLALHENGCRCIYEYFRSDLPCVISSYSAGVNFKIFTPQTGLAVPDRGLPDAICRVLENRIGFSPRRWFLENSGSVHSSRRLNDLFKKRFAEWGYDWTEDIVPLGSGGANRYVSASDYERFRPEFQRLHDMFTRTGRFPVSLTVD